MFWYLDRPENRPRAFMQKVRAKEESGEFARLPDEEQKKIIKTIVTWDQARGRNFYQPNKKMYWWFIMPQWIKGIRGGNQSGKTSGCVIDFVMQIEGWHPLQKANMERLMEEAWDEKVRKWLKELHKIGWFYKDPPVSMRCSTVDYSNFVNEIVGPEYVKWATRNMLKEIAYDNDKKRKITWENGSFVHFMTYEQSVLTHGGAARDGIHHDEEPPSGIWSQSKMRVSTTRGRLILGMTAEQGVTWTQDEIWRPGLTRKDNSVFAVELSTYENPVVNQSTVDQIKQSCTDDAEIDIRIYGKSTPRGGNVYPMWKDTEPWVIDPFQIPQRGGYLVRAIDPHPQLPHAVLWVWVDYDGLYHQLFMKKPYLYECAELFKACPIPDLASYIREVETYQLGRKADFELCDQYAWNRDQNNPKTIADQMIEAGLMIMPASKDKDAGILKIKEMLSLQFGKELPEDREQTVVIQRQYPQIMTFDTLDELRKERKKYRWQKGRQRYSDDLRVKQKPVDKDDHFMENEYRIALFVVEGQFEIVQENSNTLADNYPIYIGGKKMDVDFKRDKWAPVDACLM